MYSPKKGMVKNMAYSIRFLKKGIVRISEDARKSVNYLERYGIISVPKTCEDQDVELSGDRIVFPDGRVLRFSLRPEKDDELWSGEIAYLNRKFAGTEEHFKKIIGTPENSGKESPVAVRADDGENHFGISFTIEDHEKFYGLGEGNREAIQHRGSSFQNWAVYQFNEIPIPLVISNRNWGILIAAQDRHFVDIDDHIKGKLTAVGNRDELDIYVLYGESMKDILRLYTELTGKSMLLPKWAYGLTYIAPIHQNQWELMNDMAKFREKHIPCDNVSLEPGWMSKFYDYSFEKNWNLEKFHIDFWMQKRDHPYTFISALRRMGYHTSLWFCSRYDFCDQEERKVTGSGKLPAWYDHTEKFVNAGIDGFKLDPADMLMRADSETVYTNGRTALEMHNVSQVLLPRQVREGYEWQTGQRPFLHYCGGYTGQQTCGAANTGDNGGGHGSMIWLLNLAMSGFMNATVDMEIFDLPTIHYAMLAPWAHHNAWMGVGQPWYAGEANEIAYTNYARLRYRLLPYLYSCAIECRETGVPMLRPMPLEFQDDPTCEELCNQYLLGENLLISAFTDEIYLPEGRWMDVWTGEYHEGRRWLKEMRFPRFVGGGLFVRCGAILPQWSDRDYLGQTNEETIRLHVYPCGESRFLFREDDGTSLDYKTVAACCTEITCAESADLVTVTIGERKGDYRGKPDRRVWELCVHDPQDREVRAVCASNTDVCRICRETATENGSFVERKAWSFI